VQIQGADVTIRESELRGSGPDSHALRKGSGSAEVALSQLVGGVTNLDRPCTLRCFNNYDENIRPNG